MSNSDNKKLVMRNKTKHNRIGYYIESNFTLADDRMHKNEEAYHNVRKKEVTE